MHTLTNLRRALGLDPTANKNLTKKFINNQLKKVSRIPKATERIRSAIDIVPKIFSFAKNFSISRR